MNETSEADGRDDEQTVRRLLDLVERLTREYGHLATSIGRDERVPADLRRDMLAYTSGVAGELAAALAELRQAGPARPREDEMPGQARR